MRINHQCQFSSYLPAGKERWHVALTFQFLFYTQNGIVLHTPVLMCEFNHTPRTHIAKRNKEHNTPQQRLLIATPPTRLQTQWWNKGKKCASARLLLELDWIRTPTSSFFALREANLEGHAFVCCNRQQLYERDSSWWPCFDVCTPVEQAGVVLVWFTWVRLCLHSWVVGRD